MMLKKTMMMTLLCMGLITAVAPLTAQGIGVKGSLGLNRFNLSTEMVGSNVKDRLGFSAGLIGILPINEMFSLRGELVYAQKGQKNELITANEATAVTKMDYIELPILAQAAIPASETVQPMIFAGGYAAYLLSAKMIAPDDKTTDLIDNSRKLDYGLVFGAGVQLAMGESKLLLDARYNLGLQNINDIKDSTLKIRNRGLVFSAGILF